MAKEWLNAGDERPTNPEASRRYCRLEQLNPEWWATAARLLARRGEFFPGIRVAGAARLELEWWGEPLLVEPRTRKMWTAAGRVPGYQEGLVVLGLLNYAAGHDRLPPERGLVTAEHLRGGATFFRGPHVMASVLIARRFARRGREFRQRGLAAGGREAPYGEYGVEFTWFPGCRWLVALWEEDEEFPARATYLFDRCLEELFALDVVWALGNVVAARFGVW
ncbi:MAG: DUF3786 domain-containing protein [Deltaproteobacteria bacterium]|nr:DUF3786 domain-containing protein [Deltaproteobacteria bacterium]